MRIVDICAFYAPQGGGVKTYVERKLKAGNARGVEVIIVAPGEDNDIRSRGSGGALATLAAPRFPLDRRYRYFNDEQSLHALLDRLRPDIVEASSPWSSANMVARWRGSAPRALIMHADPLSAYAYRWFGAVASRAAIDRGFDWFWRHLRRLDQSFDMVVSASPSLSRRLQGGGLDNVVTLPMGVEPDLFNPRRRDPAVRARLLERCGLLPTAHLLIGLGRLSSEKRWPMVIKAVTAAGYHHPVGLILFGSGRDQAKVVRAAANNPHIHLAAPVTDREELAAILASADALVHGCEAETFCMAAAEAKASGLPLIVPNEGGAGDQWAAGQGLRYEAASAASLAAGLAHFLAGDPAGHRERATVTAERVRTMDQHFDDLFGIYCGRLEGHRHAA